MKSKLFVHSSKMEKPAIVDALTEMLRGLRLDGVEYGRCKPCAPWATSYPAGEAARFHFLAGGQAWMQAPDGEWMQLKCGDAVLLPRGDAHVLASEPGIVPTPFGSLPRKTLCDGIVDVQSSGEEGTNRLFFAVMRFNVDKHHPLLQMMPDVMKTSDLAKSEPTIPPLLDAMMRETEMNRVGSGGMLARLADVLTATIIRTWVEHGGAQSSGWLAAVNNPDIGRVLAAIHNDPSQDWNVEELAKLMGASRSGFAQRFADAVGETPARYVARTRMQQAHQWLRDGQRVSSVAEKLGYDSEASFSRAFKRIMGAAPSQFRKRKSETTQMGSN